MRNALVATAMLLAGVATVASAQDTTRAGQQADTTIKREGQQAQADSAWKQKGVAKDSAMMHGRDSLPKGEKKAQSEQDAVNPKLDAQGRPDSAGAAARNPTSSSIQTMEPTPSAGTPAAPRSTTSPNTELSSADGSRRSTLSANEWFTDLRAQAEDQKISQDPSVVPNRTMQQGQAEPQSQPSQPQEQSQAGGVNPSTGTSTTVTSNTGQQQNTANAQENREGAGTGSTGTSVTPK